jgi:hypothetical protein
MKEAIIAISDGELLLQVAYDGISISGPLRQRFSTTGTRPGTENSNNFENL